MFAIETRGLKKDFASKNKVTRALAGVDLNIRKNRVFGLLGPNGAGKTTLIYVLSTLLLPTEGWGRVLGHDIIREHQDVRESIGICLSGTRLHGEFTPRELLRYYSMLYGIPKVKRELKIKELIRDLKMTGFRHKKFFELSTGMKQKVAVAKSLLNEPEVLFLDEPTAGLDVEIAMEVRKYIANLVDTKEMTVILTSHQLYEVEEMCREIAIIDKGRIVSQGDVRSIRKNLDFPDMAYFYLDRYDRTDFLGKIPGVIEYSMNEDGLFVKTRSGAKTVKDIMNGFERKGVKVMDMEIRKATLEEVFMRIVGKTVRRDEDV